MSFRDYHVMFDYGTYCSDIGLSVHAWHFEFFHINSRGTVIERYDGPSIHSANVFSGVG